MLDSPRAELPMSQVGVFLLARANKARNKKVSHAKTQNVTIFYSSSQLGPL
jgi:hypothetical protein